MIIDFHTHIFPDKIAAKSIASLERASGIKAATDGTQKGLLDSMNSMGIDRCVIQPVVTKPAQFDSINAFSAKINEQYGDRLTAFGGIHPDCENYKEELRKIKELGLPGVKIHPDYQGVMIDDLRYMNIIEYASELGLIILTHAGIDIGLPDPVHCPPDKVRYVIDKIKPEKLVLAHYGGWKQWEEVYELLAGENVYFDTAFTFDYISGEMFLKILKKHDPKKILFATDSPWSNASRDVKALKALNLEKAVEEDILANNARDLLQLK